MYGRIENDGWVVIMKNNQAINFYADSGDISHDLPWRWIDTVFQAIATEYGIRTAIETKLYLQNR
tara:strand:- start:231 stop:425 length:195 start_codon:yes stop_codon:yes gene_type:complete